MPTAVISHRGQPDRETFDRAVSAELERHGVELVALAGFMRIFSPWFPTRWADRLINIHPSLLPCFKGLHVQQQALDAGVRLSGCTVHFVIPDLDAGPIIAQAAVPVLAGDTAETLSARILRQEHRLYPLVVRWFAEGRIALAAGRVGDQRRAARRHPALLDRPLVRYKSARDFLRGTDMTDVQDDLPAHVQTYQSFSKLVLFAILFIVLLLVLHGAGPGRQPSHLRPAARHRRHHGAAGRLRRPGLTRRPPAQRKAAHPGRFFMSDCPAQPTISDPAKK